MSLKCLDERRDYPLEDSLDSGISCLRGDKNGNIMVLCLRTFVFGTSFMVSHLSDQVDQVPSKQNELVLKN
jgi:hypothetical protein